MANEQVIKLITGLGFSAVLAVLLLRQAFVPSYEVSEIAIAILLGLISALYGLEIDLGHLFGGNGDS